jgi:ketosteroid isomerase-like protein
MSEENVEVVRQIYDAAARRDSETILKLYDPKVEIDVSRTHSGVMEPFYTGAGHEAIRRWSHEWHEAWESVEYEVEEVLDAGDDVICVITARGRGKSSGAPVEFLHHAGRWSIRDGRVVRVEWFQSRAEALEAAGQSG